jgi:hypothetical protein
VQWTGQNTTWSSKINGKDKILPGLARAMEKTKYYLVYQEQWKGQTATWSSKSNGKDKILPGQARAMERTKYYLV